VSSAFDPTTVSGSGITFTSSNRKAEMTTAEGPRQFLGTQVRSTGKYWIEFDCSYSSGSAIAPGLKDTGSGAIIYYSPDSSSGFTAWTTAWSVGSYPRTAKVRFEIDRTAGTMQAFVNGVSAGSQTIPAGLVNPRPWGELAYNTGPFMTINTGQSAPMGGATSGFTAWG
jgi:hypothetical protein